jgi:Na+-transporting methylmalonyl-CoA/oxaloacetate decarboxylase gamma subunit
MWSEGLRIATMGFSVVFITLLILAISVKVMSFLCRGLSKKVVRKGGERL